MKKTIPKIKITLFLFFLSTVLIAGYGDFSDELPSRLEREVLVMTNAVRMDPVGFRDKFIKNAVILLPSNYPAVEPVWYNQELSKAARIHSEDMANNCGLSHNSCDGTTFFKRVTSYYKGSGWLGENIATGNSTGIQTVIQWLRDDNTQKIPASDKSSSDGHRQNIMNAQYHEMGAGYSYSKSRQWYHFWTQDFGGGIGFDYKIPSGCHFSIPGTATEISFAANYYDKSGTAPEKASVFIDNIEHSMVLFLGKASSGTYIYSTSDDKKPHCYYFLFTSKDHTIRYPQTNTLSTSSDSGCLSASVKHFTSNQSQKTIILQTTKTDIYTINGVKQSSISAAANKKASGILLYTLPGQNQGIKKLIYLKK